MVIVLLLIVASALLSLPSVQTTIAGRVTRSINQKYNVAININKIKIAPIVGGLSLHDIYIEDHKKDTLIYIRSLRTSILSTRNAINGKAEFGAMTVKELLLNMKTYEGEKKSNLDIFVARMESDTTTTSSGSFLLSIAHIALSDGHFRLIDENDARPEILDFKQINAEVDDFKIDGSNVSTTVENLAFVWDNGLVIRELSSGFSYAPNRMEFADFSIATTGSELRGDLAFNYNKGDLKNFMNKVTIDGNLEHAVIALNEANLFYDAFGVSRKATLSSGFSGTLNSLEAHQARIVSENTAVEGTFHFYNLFNKKEPFSVAADIMESSSSYNELVALLPDILGNSLPASLVKLGQVTANGHTTVTANTVDAALDIGTALGSGYTDLNLEHINTITDITYEGDVSLNNFHLGKLINENSLGSVSLDVNVEGRGFTQESLNTEIIGKVFRIGYNDYNYKNIEVSGVVKDQLFDGSLVTDDENLKLDFKGLVDFSQKINKFNFVAVADYADLKKLHFFDRDNVSVFKGEIRMDMAGNTIDDISGTVSFSKTNYINQNDNYYFGDFKVTSVFEGEERILEINSPDIMTGRVKGKFYVNEVDKLIQNSIGSIYTNYHPYEIAPDQHMEFNFDIYNKIVEVFYPEVEFGTDTHIKGSMRADNGEFKLAFESPHISLFDVVLDDIDFRIDNKNPISNIYVEIDKIGTPVYDIADFSLINFEVGDKFYIKTEFKGGDEHNDTYDFNLYHTFNSDEKLEVGVNPSKIVFKGNEWMLNREKNSENKVIFDEDIIDIRNIVMNHRNEQINLTGKLIDSSYKNVKLQFKDVSLHKITPAIDSLSLDGLMNGELNILQTNGNYLPSSNLIVDDFTVNSNNLGNLRVGITGKGNLSRYDVDIDLINGDVQSLNVEGDIVVSGNATTIDLDATMRDLNLEMFSPLGQGVISDIRGYASGDVKISGPAKNPGINGALFLDNAGMRIPYLNVDVSVDNATRVDLYGQTFEFNDAIVYDTEFNTWTLFNGTISHVNFDKWYMDLKLDTQGNRFLVLNTQESEDALYYGTGFMNGTGAIFGYTDQLNIQVNATTGEGTSLKIPINEVTSVGDVSFINFINKNEKDTLSGSGELLEYKGLELEFDLDVTPDAEVEIVIDKRSGSTLKGTGAGNLLIEINTNGKFRMWGDFITYTGTYNFRYGGFINKQFTVLPGGTINWEGDPFNAAIDMKALYSLSANPGLLLETNNFRRKVPTEVEIQLQGDLEQIEPDFEIRFPGMSSVENSELQYRLQEKDRRQLQALSLLSQGTFISEFSISQEALTGNLIETASGLVNEILNDSDGKFDIGISYEQGGRNPDSDFQLDDRFGVTISTQISERILVNGKIGVPVGGVAETAVVGDVEVQVLLNQDGSLSAKIFNKENEVLQQFLTDQQGYTQGVGLSYQVEFNSLQELLRKIFKGSGKKEKKKQEEQPPQDAAGDGFINFTDKNKKKNTKSEVKPGSGKR